MRRPKKKTTIANIQLKAYQKTQIKKGNKF